MIKIKAVLDWTIPCFGNKRREPYGTLVVSDGEKEKVVKMKEGNGGTYIVVNRKRYSIVNHGSLWKPRLEAKEY